MLDRFMALLEEHVTAIRVGDPLDPETEMGPLISAGQRDSRRVVPATTATRSPSAAARPTARASGLRRRSSRPVDARRARRARGGLRADRRRDPVPRRGGCGALANDTIYGLSGSIWTRDGARALRVARAIETGVLSINSNSSVRVTTPFGGFKQSGYGRELGPHALDAYTEVKSIYFATS